MRRLLIILTSISTGVFASSIPENLQTQLNSGKAHLIEPHTRSEAANSLNEQFCNQQGMQDVTDQWTVIEGNKTHGSIICVSNQAESNQISNGNSVGEVDPATGLPKLMAPQVNDVSITQVPNGTVPPHYYINGNIVISNATPGGTAFGSMGVNGGLDCATGGTGAYQGPTINVHMYTICSAVGRGPAQSFVSGGYMGNQRTAYGTVNRRD